jgi:hypothetical protein
VRLKVSPKTPTPAGNRMRIPGPSNLTEFPLFKWDFLWSSSRPSEEEDHCCGRAVVMSGDREELSRPVYPELQLAVTCLAERSELNCERREGSACSQLFSFRCPLCSAFVKLNTKLNNPLNYNSCSAAQDPL